MPNTKKNERYIPTKNYVTAFIIILIIIILTLYIFEWYKVYEKNQVEQSYLIKSNIIRNEIKEIKEVEAIFTEVPDDYFIYISYTGNKEIYNMEKDLKDIISRYNINDKFYFINVTDMMKNDNYIEELNNSLGLEEQKITKVPTIIYYKNGEVAKNGILTRDDDNIINAGDFGQFLETREYKN